MPTVLFQISNQAIEFVPQLGEKSGAVADELVLFLLQMTIVEYKVDHEILLRE